MTASRYPTAADGIRGINIVVLGDGREIHIDDIATADEGQGILDEIDAALLLIEDQLDNVHPRQTPEWRRRAETAHKKKRRIRPALQRRIAELRRAERQAVSGAGDEKASSAKDAQRKAFVAAAIQMLDHELVTEIWQRASELKPAAFADGATSR